MIDVLQTVALLMLALVCASLLLLLLALKRRLERVETAYALRLLYERMLTAEIAERQ